MINSVEAAAPLRTVIVGTEFAATLVAAALARHQDLARRPVRVLLLPRVASDPAWPVDATLPWYVLPKMRALLEGDGIHAPDCSSSWGIALTGWGGTGHSAFLPFGSVGAPFGPIGFQHVVQRLRRDGAQLRFANYALAALAAQAGRFERPGSDPRSVLTTAEYGLHLDMDRAVARLRSAADRAGIVFEHCSSAVAQRDAQGRCQAIVTADGRRIEADFFIDCSRDGLLRPTNAADGSWVDWSAWLRADRVLTCHADSAAVSEPFSEARAITGGWLRRVPMHGRVAVTAHFDSQELDDTSLHVALRALAGAPVSEVRITHAQVGRLKDAWSENLVALGTAAARVDPLVVSDLQLLCVGIERLLHLLPGDPLDMRAEALEFNRRFSGYADRARDLAIAHYLLNGRRGEPFWDAVRGMAVPESLSAKLALYGGRGQVSLYDDEPLEQWGWICLLDELGVRPQNYSPLADGVPTEQLVAHAAKARTLMLEAVARMPAHGAARS